MNLNYSGLDWSEDVGGPIGYMAMVHLAGEDIPVLEGELAAARRRLGYKPDHPFKHTEAKETTHVQFYTALRNVPGLTAHVYRYDRAGWTARYAPPVRGDPCICDALITLTLRCPREWVERQILFIDYPRRERDIVVAFATALRNAMKGTLQRSFRDIRPRPDDRIESGIVQVADMIAGEIRQYSGLAGPYLPQVGRRIEIV